MTRYVPKPDLINILAERCESWNEASTVLKMLSELRVDMYKDAFKITSLEWFLARNQYLKALGKPALPARYVELTVEDIAVEAGVTAKGFALSVKANCRVVADGCIAGWREVDVSPQQFAGLTTKDELVDLLVESANDGSRPDLVYNVVAKESVMLMNPIDPKYLNQGLKLLVASVAKYVKAMENAK